ncbi:MAG TPA: ABC transporter permease [Candidatus Fraserbacteria bacterium]|nr:ABC transporter permease [Candidatus Fraserbacteria bacterium]
MNETSAPATPQSQEQAQSPEEQVYQPTSQARLIWHRFLRHKLGVLGGVTIAFLVLIFLFAEFVSPYNYHKSHYAYPYVPPMLGRIHFDGLRPYVYGLIKKNVYVEYGGVRNRLPGVLRYAENRSRKYPIKFFVHGDKYQLFGFIPTDIHLFGTGEPPNSPGQFFLFGTDSQGYDIFSQTLFGGRVSLSIGPIVILISFLFGTLLGGFSGYLGGVADTLIQRFLEIFMSLPRLALLLAIAGILAHLGNIPAMVRYWSIVGVLALVNWAPLARVIRGQFLALRNSEYTQAAQAIGAGDLRVIFRHIMPNIMSYLVVAATLAVPDIIILESILSFLGYGIQDPLISWGMLLHSFEGSGFNFQMQFHAWLLLPAAFIVVTVLAFNFMGDALRDAVDPYTVAEVKEGAL